VDDVIFAVHRRELDRLEDLFLSLQEQGIRTRFAMDLFPHTRARVELEELDGVPLVSFSTTPTSTLQLMLKRALDVALAAFLLLIGTPIAGMIALTIKLTSRGNVLFRQTRCGLNGRSFTLYKFRTMVEDAEERRRELMHLNEMNGPVFKLKLDPRVTRLGRFLRRFSLDELPQLWNVLRGDMSLVGPRPPIPEEVAQYQRWQRRRLAMKPGLTCLWQISGRNNVDFDRWMQLDLEYIDSWSPLLDLKILLKTVPVVLSGRGAS
jgi:exopolysaccharide biosynthesis polyprenyl glycosylphosphotransferase